ncbi:MAG: hypothetical protein AB1351_03320 [Thermoproteota archaeon]
MQGSNEGIITVMAWNTEGQGTNFDCEPNPLLYRYFQSQEPIPLLLLVDNKARWNQELENVYLVSCQIFWDAQGHKSEHYEYELRPDPQ